MRNLLWDNEVDGFSLALGGGFKLYIAHRESATWTMYLVNTVQREVDNRLIIGYLMDSDYGSTDEVQKYAILFACDRFKSLYNCAVAMA